MLFIVSLGKMDQENVDPSQIKRLETINSSFSDLYENHPEVYDVFSKQQIVKSNLVEEVGKVIEANARPTDNTFLDIGCGTGVMISLLAPRFPNINFIGVDPAERSLKHAAERCSQYNNVSFRLGTVEDLEEKKEKFNVVFTSWGHIKWNKQGHIMESVAAENAIVILINNWGENDDFVKFWPDYANQKYIKRRRLMEEGHFNVFRLDSFVDLTDKLLYASMSAIFGEEYVQKHRSNSFNIGIAVGWKKTL